MNKTNEFTIIGVDVAKLKLDVALDDKHTIAVANDEEGFTKLLKAVPNLDQVCFVMEATGGYEKPLANFLQSKGYAVAVVNAKRVRDYANAMGAYAKNDRIDAQMIRHYGPIGLCQRPTETARITHSGRTKTRSAASAS